MKPDIHPNYAVIKATCSCGNVITTKSTLGKDILIEVCSNCHPFHTGKQKILDSGGRVDRFKKRFGCGGTIKDGVLEIQGDRRDLLQKEFEKDGYKIKRVGG